MSVVEVLHECTAHSSNGVDRHQCCISTDIVGRIGSGIHGRSQGHLDRFSGSIEVTDLSHLVLEQSAAF